MDVGTQVIRIDAEVSPNYIRRVGDTSPPGTLSNFKSLAERTADPPVSIPEKLPASTAKLEQPRFTESSIYPYLETNVSDVPMQFSQEPFPAEVSERTRALYGATSPFRHWQVVRQYIESIYLRNGYEDLVSFNTTVERVEKIGSEWKVTLRKEGKVTDYWWVELFDAVVVASGHYAVPYIPAVEGLEEFEKYRPGSVIHSKHFRGKEKFAGKVSSPTGLPLPKGCADGPGRSELSSLALRFQRQI